MDIETMRAQVAAHDAAIEAEARAVAVKLTGSKAWRDAADAVAALVERHPSPAPGSPLALAGVAFDLIAAVAERGAAQ